MFFFKVNKTFYKIFRYNPGDNISDLDISNEKIIGNPKESKFGVTKDQLFEGFKILKLKILKIKIGYKILKSKNITRFGLHWYFFI
jgi:hypothetical protein